jgi:hypothetical protein
MGYLVKNLILIIDMKNLFVVMAIVGLMGCGNHGECENCETAAQDSTAHVAPVDSVGELLDSLETLPSATPEAAQ